MKHTHYTRGFTLIDLAIYSGLLGILLVILSEIFISIVQLQLSSSSQGVVEQNGAYILSRITYDIRRTSRITSPLLGETVATLSAVIADTGSDIPYTYELQNENLFLTLGSSVTQVNSTDTRISDFTVKKIGNSGQVATAKDTIQVSFIVHSRGVVSASLNERPYQTVVSLR